MITIERTTDLSKLLKPEALTGQVFNNESGGHRFIISCTRNGAFEPLTGSITGRFLRPDGVGVQLTSSYTSIDSMGRAVVTLPSNCYIKTGAFTLVITHVDSSSNRTNIYAGAGYVRVGETDTIVDPENIINVDAIQALIDDMIEATDDAEAAAAFVPDIIAAEFAAATAYSAGTYVTYDNKLYRITADHAANTTWANTSKVLVTVGKEVTDLKSALEPLNMFYDTIKYTATSGYQNVPMTISAGKYKVTSHNCGATMTFRDSNGNEITGISVNRYADNDDLTITSAQASAIASLRMYQGYVTILPADNIVAEVDANTTAVNALELGVNTYTYTASSGYQNIPIEMTAGKYKATCTGTTTTIAFRDSSNNEVSGLSIPPTAYNYEFEVSSAQAAAIEYIRIYQGSVSISKAGNIVLRVGDLETNTTYDLQESREARYNMENKNPFVWKPFDKAYFSWMNDDGRSDMYLYKNLCDTYNIPYANAVPWEKIRDNTTTVDNMTLVNYCKKIINEDGEIFVHANNALTSSSTEEDIIQLFRDGKRIIEDALETSIYGIIEVGGTNYNSFNYTVGQKYCLNYYEFSDDYGTSPQYKLGRTRILRANYDSDAAQVAAFKTIIDNAIANKEWVRFYCHGTDEVSISVLTSVFDYVATKVSNGDCAWTSWKSMYDTFRGSQLETEIEDTLSTSHFEKVDIGTIENLELGSSSISSTSGKKLLIWFPVEKDVEYTVDKHMLTNYFRIGYSTVVPAAGVSITNYESLGPSKPYVTFVAVKTGYACVKIFDEATDSVSGYSACKSKTVAYAGNHIDTITQATERLKNLDGQTFYCGPNRVLNTLKAGLEEATKYMDSTLYVDPGEYDLVDEFGETWFDNLGSGDTLSGLILKNRVHVIFSPNSKVVSNYSGSNQYAHSLYSPFNAGEYGFTLENLTLECSNCRYAVHDERNGGTEQYKAEYINCNMYIDNSENTDWVSKHCIGGGLGSNAEIVIKNSIFKTDDATVRGGVYYHQSNDINNTNYKSVLVIDGCYFVTGTVTISDVRTTSTGNGKTSYMITGNSFPVKYSNTDAQGVYVSDMTNTNSTLYEWNNIIRTV